MLNSYSLSLLVSIVMWFWISPSLCLVFCCLQQVSDMHSHFNALMMHSMLRVVELINTIISLITLVSLSNMHIHMC